MGALVRLGDAEFVFYPGRHMTSLRPWVLEMTRW